MEKLSDKCFYGAEELRAEIDKFEEILAKKKATLNEILDPVIKISAELSREEYELLYTYVNYGNRSIELLNKYDNLPFKQDRQTNQNLWNKIDIVK
jgi:hypothetical protein